MNKRNNIKLIKKDFISIVLVKGNKQDTESNCIYVNDEKNNKKRYK
jgi:hypothetical protein